MKAAAALVVVVDVVAPTPPLLTCYKNLERETVKITTIISVRVCDFCRTKGFKPQIIRNFGGCVFSGFLCWTTMRRLNARWAQQYRQARSDRSGFL